MTVDVAKLKGRYYNIIVEINKMLDYGINCGIENLEAEAELLGKYIFLIESGCDFSEVFDEICRYIRKNIRETFIFLETQPDTLDCCEEAETYFLP